MKPAIPITDARFKYVNATNTDIRKTFARARREAMTEAEQPANVKSIKPRSKTA